MPSINVSPPGVPVITRPAPNAPRNPIANEKASRGAGESMVAMMLMPTSVPPPTSRRAGCSVG